MLIAVAWQVALVLIMTLGTGVLSDWTHASHLALGGAVAIIPQGLLTVWWLIRQSNKTGRHPATFFIGEFARVVCTLALMGAVVKATPALHWLPFLVGLIVALKAVGFALWVRPAAQGFNQAPSPIARSGVVSERY